MKIKPLDRLVGLCIAVPGIAVCFVALIGFLQMIHSNGFSYSEKPFLQEHYLAVGKAYSQAFTVGFFFCLFLVTVAVVFASWLEQRRGLSNAPDPSPAETRITARVTSPATLLREP